MKKITEIMLLSGILLASAQAAEISWTTNAITGKASEIITDGMLVEAVNGVGDDVEISPTINGVTFTSVWTLLGGSYKKSTWDQATDDPGYDQLLSTIDFESDITGAHTITTFRNLVVGQEYLIQYWYADSDWQRNDRTLTFNGTGQNRINGFLYGVGRFIADASTQDLVVTSSHDGPRLTAYQLRTFLVQETLGLLF